MVEIRSPPFVYLCKNLVTEPLVDEFISRINKESLSNMVMFGIICGYGDWTTRNIMLRHINGQIHFVLVDFKCVNQFYRRQVMFPYKLFNDSDLFSRKLREQISFD
jgi:hypothetical protein